MLCGVDPLLVVGRSVRGDLRSVVCKVWLIKACGLLQNRGYTLSGHRPSRFSDVAVTTTRILDYTVQSFRRELTLCLSSAYVFSLSVTGCSPRANAPCRLEKVGVVIT